MNPIIVLDRRTRDKNKARLGDKNIAISSNEKKNREKGRKGRKFQMRRRE